MSNSELPPVEFTLVAMATEDGYIAREAGHSPASWASREEQDLFFGEVASADWSIMGRGTHQVADRAERRRIVFSGSVERPDWRRSNQLWLDPRDLTPDALPALVAGRWPMRRALILGATRVHDWFLAHRRIDRVLLTVEPVRFGGGLPIFSRHAGPPEAALASAGFRLADSQRLNAAGTKLLTYLP